MFGNSIKSACRAPFARQSTERVHMYATNIDTLPPTAEPITTLAMVQQADYANKTVLRDIFSTCLMLSKIYKYSMLHVVI